MWIVVASAAAWAQDGGLLSCEGIRAMLEIHLPTQNILDVIHESRGPPGTAGCLAHAGVDAAIVTATEAVVDPSLPPESEAAPLAVRPEVLSGGPPREVSLDPEQNGQRPQPSLGPRPAQVRPQAECAASARLLELQLQMPDPGAATTLNAFVGFGAGHFYAESPAAVPLAVGEVIGVALAIGGSVALGNAVSDGGDPAAGRALIYIGLGTATVSRLVGTAMAPGAARRRSQAMLSAHRAYSGR